MAGVRGPIDVRLWRKVIKRGPNDCWEWTGTKNNHGYGMIGAGSALAGKKLAHRVAYELANGEIPRGLVVRHSCDNPACCNPAHLSIGTMKDNSGDMAHRRRGRGMVLTDAAVIGMRLDYIKGDDKSEIMRRYGVTFANLTDIISGKRWAHLLSHPGAALDDLKAARRTISNAIITRQDAETIRCRLAEGARGIDIAAEYGIHKATVSDIKRRKIWA